MATAGISVGCLEAAGVVSIATVATSSMVVCSSANIVAAIRGRRLPRPAARLRDVPGAPSVRAGPDDVKAFIDGKLLGGVADVGFDGESLLCAEVEGDYKPTIAVCGAQINMFGDTIRIQHSLARDVELKFSSEKLATQWKNEIRHCEDMRSPYERIDQLRSCVLQQQLQIKGLSQKVKNSEKEISKLEVYQSKYLLLEAAGAGHGAHAKIQGHRTEVDEMHDLLMRKLSFLEEQIPTKHKELEDMHDALHSRLANIEVPDPKKEQDAIALENQRLHADLKRADSTRMQMQQLIERLEARLAHIEDKGVVQVANGGNESMIQMRIRATEIEQKAILLESRLAVVEKEAPGPHVFRKMPAHAKKKELEVLTQQLERRLEKISSGSVRVAGCHQVIDHAEHTVSQVRTTASSLQSKSAHLETRLAHLEQDSMVSPAQVEHKQKSALFESSNSHPQDKRSVEELLRKLQEAESHRLQCEATIAEMEARLQAAEKAVEMAVQSAGSESGMIPEEQYLQLQQSLHAYEAEVKPKVEQQIADLKQQDLIIQSLAAEKDQLASEKDADLKQQDLIIQSLAAEKDQLASEKEQFENEYRQLIIQYETLQNESSRLLETQSMQDKEDPQVPLLKQDLDMAQAKASDAEHQRNQAQAKVYTLQEELEDLRLQYSKQAQQLEILPKTEQKLRGLEELHGGLKKEKSAVDQMLRALKDEKRALEQKVVDAESSREMMAKEFENEIVATQQRHIEEVQRAQGLHAESESHVSSVEILEQEKASLLQEVEGFQEVRLKLRKLEEMNNELEKEKRAVCCKVLEHEKSKKEVSKELQAMDRKLRHLEEEKRAVEQRATDVELSKENMAKEFEKEIMATQRRHTEDMQRIQVLREDLEARSAKLQILEQEKASLVKEVQGLQEVHQVLHGDLKVHSGKVQSLEQEKQSLLNEMQGHQEVHQKLRGLEELHGGLQEEKRAVDQKLASLLNEVQGHQEVHQEVHQKLRGLEELHGGLQEEKRSVDQKVREHEQNYKLMTEELQMMEQKLKALEEEKMVVLQKAVEVEASKEMLTKEFKNEMTEAQKRHAEEVRLMKEMHNDRELHFNRVQVLEKEKESLLTQTQSLREADQKLRSLEELHSGLVEDKRAVDQKVMEHERHKQLMSKEFQAVDQKLRHLEKEKRAIEQRAMDIEKSKESMAKEFEKELVETQQRHTKEMQRMQGLQADRDLHFNRVQVLEQEKVDILQDVDIMSSRHQHHAQQMQQQHAQEMQHMLGLQQTHTQEMQHMGALQSAHDAHLSRVQVLEHEKAMLEIELEVVATKHRQLEKEAAGHTLESSAKNFEFQQRAMDTEVRVAQLEAQIKTAEQNKNAAQESTSQMEELLKLEKHQFVELQRTVSELQMAMRKKDAETQELQMATRSKELEVSELGQAIESRDRMLEQLQENARVKDQFIQQLQDERPGFDADRGNAWLKDETIKQLQEEKRMYESDKIKLMSENATLRSAYDDLKMVSGSPLQQVRTSAPLSPSMQIDTALRDMQVDQTLINRLTDQNNDLKYQLEGTWKRINEQARRIDDERVAFWEELQQVRGSDAKAEQVALVSRFHADGGKPLSPRSVPVVSRQISVDKPRHGSSVNVSVSSLQPPTPKSPKSAYTTGPPRSTIDSQHRRSFGNRSTGAPVPTQKGGLGSPKGSVSRLTSGASYVVSAADAKGSATRLHSAGSYTPGTPSVAVATSSRASAPSYTPGSYTPSASARPGTNLTATGSSISGVQPASASRPIYGETARVLDGKWDTPPPVRQFR